MNSLDIKEEAAGLPLENPYLEWLGVSLVEWRQGYAEIHLPMSGRLDNRSGRVHGGVICTLLDSVCGYCGQYAPPDEPPRRAVTLTLTTNFVDAAQGDTLIAKGHVQKQGRSVYFSQGEVWSGGRLIATATGTFKYMR
ncbi:MAG: PaaI family thioesterase [Alcaligenaceae bacterium]|nr:PaaI family thioesterase [Alcaligenaceae bacterium]